MSLEPLKRKTMIKESDVYKIGRLGKPHGVRGEVSFQFADDIFDRTDCDYLILSIDGILVPFFFEEYRFHGAETALVKFCDIDTQEQAANLTGCDVYFERSLADNDNENLSWAQIVGFSLVDGNSGKAIGRIASVDDSTANILFCLDDDRLIPASEELIEEVDVNGQRIVVNLPEGLMDL